MGDEDWETDITPNDDGEGERGGRDGALPSFQPGFRKLGSFAARGNESWSVKQTDASAEPSTGHQSMRSGWCPDSQGESGKPNEDDKPRGGFGSGRSFGNRERSQGFQGMSDAPYRGARGTARGNRGGFGPFANNENEKQDGRTPFGSFGFKRGGFTASAGDAENRARGFGSRGDTENRGRGFGSRGGYKGTNEEIFGGFGRSVQKSDREAEGGDFTGPKVTYVPPPPPENEEAIFAHYQTGLNFDKYDNILVEVSGLDPPPAILTFDEAGLCQTLVKNIARAGYSKLTPVQKYSIPIVLAGRDLMACAQTGSGKTAAFLIPILAHMMRDGVAATQFKQQQEPECVIVAPTRELINQIFLESRKFSYGTCIRPVVIYGGTQISHSIRQITQGCNVLCATPGRLIDMIEKEKIGLSKIRYLVLDEADRMLDMGFEKVMRELISRPGMPPKNERQTLMFSATFPEEIQRLAGDFLKTEYLFVVVGQVGGACSDVQQSVLQVSQYDKRNKLVEILQSIGDKRTMVFVETKKKADFYATLLCQENISTTSIHGDREQKEREEALYYFRSGKCPVIVATSVAARGLDIENVEHVINVDLPSSIDEYVHRIGRTGRCGNIGKAISFFDPLSDSGIAQPLVKVLADAQQEVPAWLEEIACSSHETFFSSTRGSTFASVDSRKVLHGRENQHSGGFTSPNTSENESWD